MGEPIIKLDDIVVDFKTKDQDLLAVNHVDLTVEKGDIYGIVGYSGAGKSTLVRVINLLQRPTSGAVQVNGQNILSLNDAELRQARKKIGMIFQHFNLLNSLTIEQNVAFPLRTSKLSKSEKKKKVDELLELVGLADKKDNYPRQLSGGQKQRVGIARSLANDPDILISDEATSALDPKTTESILNLLRDINEELGLTIVLITHQMEAVKQVCNRVAVMDSGEVVERGEILDIFAKPQHPLTKAFIDTTTRLDATLKVIYQQENVKNLPASDKLIKLSYVGDSTDEPLISTLYEKFNVSANILYGNIEILRGTPLGNLIVILTGAASDTEAALAFINGQDVQVTELDPKAQSEVID